MVTPTPPAAGRPVEPGPSLAQDLGFNLGVVFRAYVKAAGVIVEGIPGGPRGYQALTAAVHCEAANQSALAVRLGVDRTVMTYLVDDLEAARLVRRRPDPDDRRNRQIIATKKGQDVWQATEQRMHAVEAHVLGALPDADAAAFRGLLNRLAARANQLDPVGSACEVASDLGLDTLPGLAPPTRPRAPRRAAMLRR